MKINFDKDKGKFMRFFKELFRDIKKERDYRMQKRLVWINSKAFWFFMDWIAPILTALVVSVLFNYFLRK